MHKNGTAKKTVISTVSHKYLLDNFSMNCNNFHSSDKFTEKAEVASNM